MNASYRWLKDFVDFSMSPAELRDLLTARCATVDDVLPLRSDLSEIVIGRVVEAGRHPDSDHLWLTRVDSGLGALHHVVCGAPNVTAGALYPFARLGAVLPGGLKIEKRKIRGQLSEGMLCSARELGLGSDHEGIMELDIDATPGVRLVDAIAVGDTRLVIDVMPNRPDLLSHEGVAREIAAATGLPLRRPSIDKARGASSTDNGSEPVAIALDDTEGCMRYATAAIHGVKVGPSPDWLVARIEAVGGRSINNIVDVTNYMLHGFGHPMHAFDLNKIGGRRLIIRRASAGEPLVTLDGVDRRLDETMTVIADVHRASAIAGVIGGKGSEVGDTTTDVLLEAAAFDPRRVRATRLKLGVSTDASYRFERGVDAGAIPSLLQYAAEMIISLAGGRKGAVSDSGEAAVSPHVVSLRLSRVELVLGQSVPRENIESLLSSVGFAVSTGNGDTLTITVPSYRPDVYGEIEVIEEVARLNGYDKLPSEVRPFRPGTSPDAGMYIAARRIREACVVEGLFEARPMPFSRTGPDSHRVRNPLAGDEAFLRSSVLDTLAGRAEYNLAHMQRNIRLFEIGVVFTVGSPAPNGAPAERMHAGALIMGESRPPHFTEPRPPQFDEWDARALAESISAAAFPDAEIRLAPSVGDALWLVTVNDVAAGSVVRVRLDAPVWAAPAFGIEIDMEAVTNEARQTRRYSPVPAMPAMEVDLALVVAHTTGAAEVERVIRESAGEQLESLVLFDEFRGPGIPKGSRSLAWRLTFRHPERTLREKEIQGRTEKILGVLEAVLGIKQRRS